MFFWTSWLSHKSLRTWKWVSSQTQIAWLQHENTAGPYKNSTNCLDKPFTHFLDVHINDEHKVRGEMSVPPAVLGHSRCSTNGLVVIPPPLNHALISFLQKSGAPPPPPPHPQHILCHSVQSCKTVETCSDTADGEPWAQHSCTFTKGHKIQMNESGRNKVEQHRRK